MVRITLPLALAALLTLFAVAPAAQAHAFQSGGLAFLDDGGCPGDEGYYPDSPQVFRALASGAVAGAGTIVFRLVITDPVTNEDVVDTAFQASSNAAEGESVPPPVNDEFFVDGSSFGF